MNAFVDAMMIVLFVAFMVFVFRGYHVQRLKQIEEEEEAKKRSTDDETAADGQAPKNAHS